MGKPAVAIDLTAEERQELEGLAGRRRTAQGLARRACLACCGRSGEQRDLYGAGCRSEHSRQMAAPLCGTPV